jgi:hypothetical protein
MELQMTKLLQNPTSFCILVRREGDGKLSFVAADAEPHKLQSRQLIDGCAGFETKLLHATVSDKGFGIIRGLLREEGNAL